MRLLLINRDFQSGQTTHVDSLAAALRALGVTVAIARFGALCEPMPAARRARIPQLRFTDTRGLTRLIEGFAPDLLHAHSSSAWPLVAPVARATNRPFVLTAHGLGVDIPANRAALEQAGAVIAPGPATARSLGVPAVCIANGVDLQRFAPGPKARRPVIAYIGRVDPNRQAGFTAFCNATRQLPADVWFLGVGTRGAPAHVRAFGWRVDLDRWLPKVDIACAVGRSLREAQACGAVGLVLGERYHGPALRADLPRSRTITDVWYGDHLPPVSTERTVVQLRGDLLTLLSAPARLRLIQRESRPLAERFADLAEKARRHLVLYQAIIAGRRIAPSALPRPARPLAKGWDQLLGAGPAGAAPRRLDRLCDPQPVSRRFAIRLIRGCDVRLVAAARRAPLQLRFHMRHGRAHLTVRTDDRVIARHPLHWARWHVITIAHDSGQSQLRIDGQPIISLPRRPHGPLTLGPVRSGICHVIDAPISPRRGRESASARRA